MNRVFLSLIAGSLLWAGLAVAQTATEPGWTPEQGLAIKAYAESQKDPPFVDPNLKLTVGMELPNNVTLYPLPETMKIPSGELYTYGIVNGHPLVVNRTTRKVVHIWD